MKVALTIAGSDSGGGAGIQADLRAFAALRVYGTSVVTALTAQNTTSVTRVTVTSAEMVTAQLEAVLGDFTVAAAKTGMLANTETIEAVVACLENEARLPRVVDPVVAGPEEKPRLRPSVEAMVAGLETKTRIPLVVDPVMISKSGAALLAADAVETLKRLLLPLATVVTPNLPEAEALAGRPVDSPERLLDAAKAIADLGAGVVVIKGGHAPGDTVNDLVWDGTAAHVLFGPRIETRSTHGTGCTLSAAIAAGLALGATPVEAIRHARRYLEGAIASAKPLGAGHGPVHHMHPFYPW